MFNLASALLLLPAMGLFEKLSLKLVKDEPAEALATPQAQELRVLDGLNPVFLATPGLAFNACYDVLMEMFRVAEWNIYRAFDVVNSFDADLMDRIRADEDALDIMADRVSGYLMQISAHITSDEHSEIMNHYYSTISEFERLGDHAMNIAEDAEEMNKEGVIFSETALKELAVVRDLLRAVLNYTGRTFEKCDAKAAAHIEPLEEGRGRHGQRPAPEPPGAPAAAPVLGAGRHGVFEHALRHRAHLGYLLQRGRVYHRAGQAGDQA